MCHWRHKPLAIPVHVQSFNQIYRMFRPFSITKQTLFCTRNEASPWKRTHSATSDSGFIYNKCHFTSLRYTDIHNYVLISTYTFSYSHDAGANVCIHVYVKLQVRFQSSFSTSIFSFSFKYVICFNHISYGFAHFKLYATLR